MTRYRQQHSPQAGRGLSRRDLLKLGASSLAATGLGASASTLAVTAADATIGQLAAEVGTYPYELPPLGYPEDALEPAIDAETMQIHHGRHHQTYVDNLNEALAPYPELQGFALTDLLGALSALPEEIREDVQDNGGGHLNHTLFWAYLTPGGSQQPAGSLASAIDDTFGSYGDFQETFAETASGRFGAGWAWLVLTPFGELQVTDTLNQDNPIMEGLTPLLGLDVWEHAYYLSYRNDRDAYIDAFWTVVNWDVVGEGFASVLRTPRRA